jgi:hypothetical protein
MNIKVKEVLQRVQALYSKGVQSDDSRLSFRHIYSIALSIRNLLLTQKLNKKQFVSQWIYQSLNCVELIKAEPHECPCLPPVGCEIMRTKNKIPKTLTSLNGHAIQSVTSIDADINFSETTWKDKKYKKGSKFTSTKPDFFVKDDYVFITAKKGPKVITIVAIFEDFLDAAQFKGLCYEPCVPDPMKKSASIVDCPECISPLDQPFLIDSDLEKTVVEMTVQELGVMVQSNREDTRNDSSGREQEQQRRQ